MRFLAPALPPEALTTATTVSPAGDYAITLTGGSDPNYALTLNDGTLQVLAGAAMTLSFEDDSGNCLIIGFGEAETANPGFDPQWDLYGTGNLNGSVSACLVNPVIEPPLGEVLVRDYGPCLQTTRWRCVVAGISARAPVTLSWNVAAAALGREVYLQEMCDEAAVGFPIDMQSEPSLALTGDAEFEIAYAEPNGTSLTMQTGWNLVGNPTMSTQSVGELLGDGTRDSITSGPAWYWEAQRYRWLGQDQPLLPERGYWVYCDVPCQDLPIPGVRADGAILLRSGWNLISPVVDGTLPAEQGLAASGWCWDSGLQIYQPVSAGDAVHAGQGYWLYVSSDTPVLLYLGE